MAHQREAHDRERVPLVLVVVSEGDLRAVGRERESDRVRDHAVPSGRGDDGAGLRVDELGRVGSYALRAGHVGSLRIVGGVRRCERGERHEDAAVGIEAPEGVVGARVLLVDLRRVVLEVVRRAALVIVRGRRRRVGGDEGRAVGADSVAHGACPLGRPADEELRRAAGLDAEHRAVLHAAADERRRVAVVVDGPLEASLGDGPRLGDGPGHLPGGDLGDLHLHRVRAGGALGDGLPELRRERDGPGAAGAVEPLVDE